MMDQSILEKILLFQSSFQRDLPSLVIQKELSSLLANLPGIADSVVCFNESITTVDSTTGHSEVSSCFADKGLDDSENHCIKGTCTYKNNPQWITLPIKSSRKIYGNVYLNFCDTAAFRPYELIVENTLFMVASQEESSDHRVRLNQIASELETQTHEQFDQLGQSELRLKEAQSVARIGSFEANYITSQLWWSEELFNLFGLDPNTFHPTKEEFIRLIHPDDQLSYREILADALQKGQSFKQEFKASHTSGEWRHFETIANVISNSQDKPIGLRGTVQDITERKNAEDSLMQSEARFRGYFELGLIGIAITSLVKGWVEFNDVLHNMMGYTHDEFLKLTWAEITHPDDLERDVKEFNRVLAGEIDGYSLEKRFIHKNGTVIYAIISAKAVKDVSGEIDHFVAFVHDISLWRRAEAELQESETTNRAILEAIPDIMFRLGLDGTHLDVYAPSHKESKISKEATLGKTVDELLPQSIAIEYHQHIANCHESKKTQQFEYQLNQDNGDIQFFEARMVPCDDASVLTLVRDITQRKQIENELHASNERFQLATEAAKLGAYDWDYVHGDIHWDAKMDELFGIIPTIDINRLEHFGKALHPEDAERIHGEFARGIDPHCPDSVFRSDYRIILPSNQIRYIETYSLHLRKDNGEVYRIIGACLDITERKLAEEALRESENRFRAYVEHSPLGILIADEKGNYIDVNPAAENLSGYNRSELMDMNFSSLVAEDDIERARDQYTELISRGYMASDYACRKKSGEIRNWSVNAVKLTSDRYLGFISDITLRKEMTEALRTNEERLDLAMSVTMDGVFDWDIITDQVYFSPRYYTMAGYAPNEFPGNFDQWAKRVHRKDYPRVEQAVKNYLEGGAAQYDEEFRFLKKDNTWLWIRARIKVVSQDDNGNPLRVVGTHTDISLDKIAEKEREELIDQLEAQNTELERFAYTVSHDLRSPLVTIKGYIGLLEKDLALGASEAVQEDLDWISKAADTMAGLLNDVLTLSRVGRVVNPPQQVSMKELLEEVLELLQGPLQEKNIRVSFSKNMPELYGDRVRLSEVFQNLIDNAVKYIGNQSDPLIEIGANLDENLVNCFVKDNGIGINPKFINTIFGLFDQLDQKAEGSGIGLALVRRIVEVHNGRVWVESEGEGKGSTFFFTLPVFKDSDE